MRKARLALLSVSTLVLFSVPVFADSISSQPITLNASSGGGINSLGLFDYRAWGYVNFPYFEEDYQGIAPTNLSFTWSQAFVLPASPVGDYLEVTHVNTYSTGGGIVVNGRVYGPDDNFDLVGLLDPDPNLYKNTHVLTDQMYLNGPIFAYVYGSFNREYQSNNCCFADEVGYSVNATSFEQFIQIERFHADGTPDPFQSAPEPGATALMLIGFLVIVIASFRSPLMALLCCTHPD